MNKRRIRRSPEEARAEILAAAEQVLENLSFNDLTVDLLMQRTTMTRSSFYYYFANLDQLALEMLRHFELDILDAVDAWYDGADVADPQGSTVAHLTAMFRVFEQHRRHVTAVAQAAGGRPGVYAEWQRRVVDYYVERTASFIRREVARGTCSIDDPERVANALILMNTAVGQQNTHRTPPDSPERLGKVLGGIWNATLFGSGRPAGA